jgi:3-phosphoglycerate kinase
MPRSSRTCQIGARREAKVGEIPADACALDIGQDTAEEYAKVIRSVKDRVRQRPDRRV